jgi:hypothetical protein
VEQLAQASLPASTSTLILGYCMKSVVTVCALATALISASAGASTITGLYNTGQGYASGSKDTHYNLTVTQGSTVRQSAGQRQQLYGMERFCHQHRF